MNPIPNPEIDFSKRLPAEYVVPPQSTGEEDNPFIPPTPPFDSLPVVVAPQFGNKFDGLPLNLSQNRTSWKALMDETLVPLITADHLGDKGMLDFVVHGNVSMLGVRYDERKKVRDMVYSVARVLLFVSPKGELALNRKLAKEIWKKGGDFCDNLDARKLKFDKVDKAEILEDAYFEELRLHKIARYLHAGGWAVPGLTPAVMETFVHFDNAPRYKYPKRDPIPLRTRVEARMMMWRELGCNYTSDTD